MNKRFKELALQCGAWNQVYDQKRFMIDKHFDIEKFAELIVQKCADIGALKADGNYEVYNSIVEYFGMQESEE
jgi:hypothetical protein